MKEIVVFTNNLYLFGKYSKRENKRQNTFYYNSTDKIFLFYMESRWYFSHILFNTENFITQSKECTPDKNILFIEWSSDIKIKKYVLNENTEKDEGEVFSDNFPNDLGDFENIVAKDNIRWEKLSNITKFFNLPVSLYQSMESTDVRQGLLGNCWLISALGCISKYPSFLKNITFKENNLNQIQDIYQITLYNFWKKKWEKISINQYVPVFQKGIVNIPLFSRNSDQNEIYLPILEKAFAKLACGYGNLISGNPGMAFITLTGCEIVECYLKNSKDNFRKFEYNIEDMRKNPRSFQYTRFKGFNVIYAENEFYEYLIEECLGNNNMITCGINSEEKRTDGLINQHSYSVINAMNVGDFRVITLQDPHGFNNTSFIPEKIFEKLEEKELTGNFSFENENCIYMEFYDFYRIFSCVQICKTNLKTINSPTQDSTHIPP